MKKIDSDQLTIPIYLNTKIVFDMLATIEDGFAEVKNVQTSKIKNQEDGVEANIGNKNSFALLNFSFKGAIKDNISNGETTSEERTHTPVSLFQKLKEQLEEANLIIKDINKIQIGNFVEIQGILKKNPVIDMLSKIKQLVPLMDILTDSDKNIKSSSNNDSKQKAEKQTKNNKSDYKKIEEQIDALIKSLQADGKQDIICESDNLSIVLLTDENYFLRNNMSEITDGNYKILGKVVKTCIEEGEISLLRNTAFSNFQAQLLNALQNAFKDESVKQLFGDENFKLVINHPVIMVIPIAVYI